MRTNIKLTQEENVKPGGTGGKAVEIISLQDNTVLRSDHLVQRVEHIYV